MKNTMKKHKTLDRLPCGCIVGYDLCPEAKKIYISPLDNPRADFRKMWKAIHEHYDNSIPPARLQVSRWFPPDP